MKTVFLLFDSLNRLLLEPYGGELLDTPNFRRLAARSMRFDKHYVGSMPCMPARRDMQTGRLSFLHRSWGPLEPFDNSFPELLRNQGVHSHLVSDHYHYWEDGGATYHTRYNTFEFIRGQESDGWKALLTSPIERLRDKYHPSNGNHGAKKRDNHVVNREFIREEHDFPGVRCFDAGLEFLELNHEADDWFLQIETFDPHEPFFAPERLRERFRTSYEGRILDWPRYDRVTEEPAEIEELRANYYALLCLCDEQLGRVLDFFDAHDLWCDTALVVTTDHGFLLGEHDWWAKNRMPLYEEIAHIPLFVHHPDHDACDGRSCDALTQTIDLMPTICELHGVTVPDEVQGHSLVSHMAGKAPERDAVMFGYWGGGINVADGRYTCFRYPADMAGQQIYEYTLMPMHMASLFSVDELKSASLVGPFDFTKGVSLLRVAYTPRAGIPGRPDPAMMADCDTALYDLDSDPGQTRPIIDPAIESRLLDRLLVLADANDAPAEIIEKIAATADR